MRAIVVAAAIVLAAGASFASNRPAPPTTAPHPGGPPQNVTFGPFTCKWETDLLSGQRTWRFYITNEGPLLPKHHTLYATLSFPPIGASKYLMFPMPHGDQRTLEVKGFDPPPGYQNSTCSVHL